MFLNKKGTELSMNVIIIAAISIMVLVILAVLVMKGAGNVDSGTGCTAIGGQCSQTALGIYTIPNPALDKTCSNVGEHCYMTIKSKD